jgi:hypothetical protein
MSSPSTEQEALDHPYELLTIRQTQGRFSVFFLSWSWTSLPHFQGCPRASRQFWSISGASMPSKRTVTPPISMELPSMMRGMPTNSVSTKESGTGTTGDMIRAFGLAGCAAGVGAAALSISMDFNVAMSCGVSIMPRSVHQPSSKQSFSFALNSPLIFSCEPSGTLTRLATISELWSRVPRIESDGANSIVSSYRLKIQTLVIDRTLVIDLIVPGQCRKE